MAAQHITRLSEKSYISKNIVKIDLHFEKRIVLYYLI